jgi:hypothetical protein
MSAVLDRFERSALAVRQRTSWDAQQTLRFAVLVLLFALLAWVHVVNMGASPLLEDDEGTYVAQAWALLERGDLAHYAYWYDHPPGGWIVIAAWAWLTDGFARVSSAVTLGREVSFIATMISSWLLYVLCRRIGMRWGWAALAVALFGLSPLAVSYHRMIFLDNLVTPWVLGVFVLMRGKRSLGAYAGAGVCFAFAVLTKLTAGIFLPLIVWELWRTAYPQHRRYAIVLMFGSFGLVAFLFPLMAILRGELLASPDNTSLMYGLQFQFIGRTASGSLFDLGSTLWVTIDRWLDTDHLIVYAGLLATLPALLFRHVRLYALVVAVHAAVLLRGGYLPVPFIIQVLPYLALVIAGSLDGLWNVLTQARHWRTPAHLVRAGAAATLIAVFAWTQLLPMGQTWPAKLTHMQTYDANVGYRDVAPWIMENIDPDSNILVENQLWLELVLAGRPEESTIWFYKLGLDPALDFEAGHEDFDYIMTSALLNSSHDASPELRKALENSSPVRRFGEGAHFVEVRRIDAERPSPSIDP